MWLRDPLVIEVADNTATPIGFQFWDEASDSPLDISDYTMACNVAPADGQSRIASFPVEITDAENGECECLFNGSAFGGGRGERVFTGQWIATDASGDSVTAARIIILVNEGID